MIRKILVFPLRILRFVLMGINVLLFIVIWLLDYLIQNKGSIDPIRYSRGGKVVDIDDFRTDTPRGEL